MAAPSIASVNTGTGTTTSGTYTFTLPSVSEGDLLIHIGIKEDGFDGNGWNSGDFSVGSGAAWTTISAGLELSTGNRQIGAAYKIANGSESATNDVQCMFATDAKAVAWCTIRIAAGDFDTDTPVATGTATGTSSNPTAASVAFTAANALVIYAALGQAGDDLGTRPSGTAEIAAAFPLEANGTGAPLDVVEKDDSSSPTGTAAWGGTNTWGAITIAVNEGSSAPSGTGAQTLPSLSQSATGVQQPEGTAAQTLPSLSQSASGSQSVSGTAGQTLPSLSQSGTGIEQPEATAAQTLPAVTQSASGVETATGTSAQTLPSLAQSASGTHTVPSATGTAAQTLAKITQSGAGILLPEGTAAQTLPSVTQAGSATSTGATTGTAAQTLASIMQNAEGPVAYDLTIAINTAYEVYLKGKTGGWERTQIVFTGESFGTP